MDGTKVAAANAALAYSSIVLVTKVLLALFSGSLTVVSETIDVIIDVAMVVVLKVVIHEASKKPDVDHTYGHGKYEGIGSIVQSTIITIVYVMIVYNALHVIVNDELSTVHGGEITITVFGILAIANIIAGGLLVQRARARQLQPIRMQGLNYLFDGIRSIMVIVALLLHASGVHLADPVMAITLSIVVIVATLACNKEPVENLLEKNPLSPSEMKEIYALKIKVPDIHDVKKVRVKRVGETIFIGMTILMDHDVTLKQAHDKTVEIEREVQHTLFPGKLLDVSVHVQDA